MSQQRQNNKIDEVIQCLIQQQKLVTLAPEASQNITHLYQSTKSLLSQFQQHINRCKKYNQAKIHRKYQILINDLSEQNSFLKSKVAEQLQARPSSKKYVSDLIDKMIEIRRQNEKLMIQNQNLQNMLTSYEQKTRFLGNSKTYSSYNNPEVKTVFKKQSQQATVKQSVKQFLANKRVGNGSTQPKQKTNFQKFLLFNKGKLQKWSLPDFFQKIDKWSLNLKDCRFLDRSKLKSSFENHFQIDKEGSHSLVIDRLPHTANSLRMTYQNKSYLQDSFSKRTRLVDRIISKRKKTTSFRLKSLSQEESQMASIRIQ